MGRAKRNPSPHVCRNTMGFAALYPSYVKQETAAVNKPNPRSPFQAIRSIDYTVIFVRDMAAMRGFYESVLSFALSRELSPGWIEYQIGGNTLALARPGRTA